MSNKERPIVIGDEVVYSKCSCGKVNKYRLTGVATVAVKKEKVALLCMNKECDRCIELPEELSSSLEDAAKEVME
jgi:hypothetical protein